MTLDERLEALTQSLELQVSLQGDAQLRNDEAIARHDREMAELRASQAKTEAELRRAFRLGVHEARAERRKRKELAEMAERRHQEAEKRHAENEKRHQELEDLFKAFLQRTGNGHN